MRFIAPRQKALRHVDRLASWRRGERPAPVTVEWDLSNACSLACADCHFAHTHEAGPWARRAARPAGYEPTGVFADVTLVRRALVEMAEAGVQAVVWSGGGEPTLHPAIAELLAAAHALELQQGLYTLGGHVDAALAAQMAATCAWVVVSLDAHTAERYAAAKGVRPERFDEACAGIRRLVAAAEGRPCTVGVSFLIDERSYGDMVAMLRLARTLGAAYTTFRPAIQTDVTAPSRPARSRAWIADARMTLEALSREPDVELDVTRFAAYADWTGHGYARCHGPVLTTTITPDGRVWICPQRRGLPGSCLGDLRTEPFAAIWARHPGGFDVDAQCRVLCRLHAVNQAVQAVFEPRPHEAFV